MGSSAANMVLILGDIGEVREEAEGANELNRFVGREAVQGGLEIATSRRVLLSTEPDRVLSNLLNGVENGLAALLADRVPKDPPEQIEYLLVAGGLCLGFRFPSGSPWSCFRRRPSMTRSP